MSNRVAPRVTRSARTSPMTLANLKPWPENPQATNTRSVRRVLREDKVLVGRVGIETGHGVDAGTIERGDQSADRGLHRAGFRGVHAAVDIIGGAACRDGRRLEGDLQRRRPVRRWRGSRRASCRLPFPRCKSESDRPGRARCRAKIGTSREPAAQLPAAARDRPKPAAPMDPVK